MKNIAIITARGGSKRIPRKNIKLFCGEPIIKYSIDAALQSGIFEEVMVSTDDHEIVRVAKQFGANVPFLRTEKNADDFATTADVLLEVIDKYEEAGRHFNTICCLYPTAPFITAETIRAAMQSLEGNKDADSLFTTVKFSYPPQRALRISDGMLSMITPENYPIRSQDFEPYYHDCGQMYLIRTDALRKHKKYLTTKTIPFIVSELEMQDLDTEEDWKIAEIKYSLLHRV